MTRIYRVCSVVALYLHHIHQLLEVLLHFILLVYHDPGSDTLNNNLLLIGCAPLFYGPISGLFMHDPEAIYANLDSVGSSTLISA